MVCKAVKGGGTQILRTLHTKSPVPTLTNGERLELVTPPPITVTDLFDQIAQFYANTIGRGKSKYRALQLTLVGVDEFDAARDQDAAGDAAFVEISGDLPRAGAAPPRSSYEHPPYWPIASSFVDYFKACVHKSKHERVDKYVNVVSSKEFLAQLGAQDRADDDWWCVEPTEVNRRMSV